MRQGDRQWSNGIFNAPALQDSNTPVMRVTKDRLRITSKAAFALYEVLLGVAVFAIGVIALGRAVENCLNASTISAEEKAVRQILSDRRSEEHTSELQSRQYLVCRLLLEKKKNTRR